MKLYSFPILLASNGNHWSHKLSHAPDMPSTVSSVCVRVCVCVVCIRVFMQARQLLLPLAVWFNKICAQLLSNSPVKTSGTKVALMNVIEDVYNI